MKGRAIILEVKRGSCTVITDGGEFLRLKIRGDFRPGQEITLPDRRRGIGRPALMAACLLMFLAATTLWRSLVPPAVAAYVSLEINSAVELALDKEYVVRGVRPLDGAGENLAAGLRLTGIPLEAAVDRIISEAVGKKTMSEDGGIVVSAVTPAGDPDPSSLGPLVKKTVETSLTSRGISARVVVGRASAEIREKAGKAGLSTGRYMIYLDASSKGLPVDTEDLRKSSIVSIERDRKIKVRETLEVEEDRQAVAAGSNRREGGDPRVQGSRGGGRYGQEAVSTSTAGKVRVRTLPGQDREVLLKKENSRHTEGHYRTGRPGAADSAGSGIQSSPGRDQARAGEGSIRVRSKISD